VGAHATGRGQREVRAVLHILDPPLTSNLAGQRHACRSLPVAALASARPVRRINAEKRAHPAFCALVVSWIRRLGTRSERSGTISGMALDAEDLHALEPIRRICRAFPGAVEAELQGRPLFRVGRRRFAIFNGAGSPARPRWEGAGRSLHFLADPTEREALRQDGRFVASPHHGDRGWFGIRMEGDLDWKELTELLDSAYQQVAPRRVVDR
jgi:predicted DNA-binding protein (MmcQ/YjbR family)